MSSDAIHVKSVAGLDKGQRHLNGPQTTGREYRNLSEPAHEITIEHDVAAVVRDGTRLMTDVYRPSSDGTFPALLAVSCYPRQIQNSGAPLGFVEAGVSDFWVPRGYGHVIANVRGTSGSEGVYGWLDEQERQDIADLVEFVAAQSWCDGNVGMIGISYFAMTQLAAAIEAPEHLRAVFPVATTADLYDAAWHHGVMSETFVTAWIAGVATFAPHGDKAFRNQVATSISEVLRSPRVHEEFQHLNGESALSILGKTLRAKFPEHPWDELWQDVAVNHQLHDEYWDERDMHALLAGCEVPMYLGCDWQNVPLHLPSTFSVWNQVSPTAPVRMGLLGDGGLTWPWESLHVEALAWFDHWLKGYDTGIMEGDPVRYFLPGAEEFRSSPTWPPTGSLRDFYLNGDGTLNNAPTEGARDYIYLPSTLSRPKGAPPLPLPSKLVWQTEPLSGSIDVVGNIELELHASVTATDIAWIVTLQDMAPDGTVEDVTAGWLRGSCREVDDPTSEPGAPELLCRRTLAIPPHDVIAYRIPLVPNARRFEIGHRIAVTIASDDITDGHPAIMGFRHQPPGDQSTNTIHASSRLRLPEIEAGV